MICVFSYVSRATSYSCKQDGPFGEGYKLTTLCIEIVGQHIKWSTGLDNFMLLLFVILLGGILAFRSLDFRFLDFRFPWLRANVLSGLGQDLGDDALLGRHDGLWVAVGGLTGVPKC